MVHRVRRAAAWLALICLTVVAGLQGGPPRAYAAWDPPGCTVNEVALSMTRTPTTAHLGDTVTFSTRINNTGPGNCSLARMTITLVTPDGVANVVASDLTIPAGTATAWFDVPYTVRAEDVRNNRVTATASAEGLSLSGPADEPTSGFQSISVSVNPAIDMLDICTQGAGPTTPASMTVNGSTSDVPAGASVTVSSGAASGSATTAGDGTWEATLPWDGTGGNRSMTASVAFGYSNAASTTETVTVEAVQIDGGENVQTHQRRPVVSGTSTGPSVTVTIDGHTESVAASGGTWSLTWPTELSYGAHMVTAQTEPCAADTQLLTVRNQPPEASDDAYSTAEDTALNVPAPGVLGNDSDPDGGSLTAGLVTGPAHGTLTLNPDGSLTYTPSAGYHGPDSFTYKATDGTDETNVATVTITVNRGNQPPVAEGNEYNTDEDTTLNVPAPGLLNNDSDPEGSALTPHLTGDPAHGTVTINPDGSFSYTPALNFYGMDSFRYAVSDGLLDSGEATVFITVNPIDDPPAAADDAYGTSEDMPLTVPAPGVLGNDSDPDSAEPLTATVAAGPAHGTLSLNTDGSFTYTPAADFNGTDTFTYTASTGGTASNVATVTITVFPENDEPVAVADAYTTNRNTTLTVAAAGILKNDSDPDGDALTAQLVAEPQHGTLTLNANGSFTYVPASGYTGTDTFQYVARDGVPDSMSEETTVTITVRRRDDPPPPPSNHAPFANHDSYTVAEDATLTVPASGVMTNDTDSDGDALTAALFSGPAHGTVALSADGSFIYTPQPLFHGTDTFKYRVSDGEDNSNVATVTIMVQHANHAPLAVNDGYTVNQDAILTVSAAGVLGNDSDPDGDALTAILLTGPTHGTAALAADGSFHYTPAAGYFGTDSFTYQAFDGTAKSNAATAQITIRPAVPPGNGKAAIEGVVIAAATGQVIAGATVGLSADFDGDGTLDFTATATTGADGRYKIEVPRGNWTYVSKVTAAVPAPGGTVSLTTTHVTVVPAGDVTSVYSAEKKIAGQVPLQPGLAGQIAAKLMAGETEVAGKTVTVHNDGLFEVSGVDAGTYRVLLRVLATDGTALAGVAFRATVTGDGELVVGAAPINPGGVVTDAVSKLPIDAAKVTLFWADTELNRQNGRTPDTPVSLPLVTGFGPGMNASPQLTLSGGAYAWLVQPDGDYYIVAEKQGYLTQRTGVIHVDDASFRYDFEMQPVHRRFIVGYPDGTFKPEQSITRAEIAAILARITQPTPVVLPAPPFQDVAANHWAATYIELVRQKGLMLGDPDGNFRPDAAITRAELATIITRFKGLPMGAPNPFTDTVDHWAEAAISAAYGTGLVTGYPDGTFHPESLTLRAEAATMINRMLGRGPLSGRSAPTWPDVPFSHWASGQVEEASSSHSADRETGSDHEHWTGDTGEVTW